MEERSTLEDIGLDAHRGEDGIIRLTVSGKITNDRLYAFVGWVEKSKKLVREAAEQGIDPILILTNASGVLHFESKPIVPLRDLLDYNKQYNIRSAVVGAKGLTKMLLDAVISFTERKNIKLFPTEKEALAWLHSSDAPS